MFNLIKILIVLTSISALGNGYNFLIDKDLVQLSRRYCEKEMGQREEGENRGFCEKYLKLLGLAPGNPYCYAGQYWCYELAARELKVVNPLPKSGLAISIYYLAKQKGIRAKRLKVDAFIVWRRMGTVFGHIERVKEVRKAGWVVTYAFNVDDGAFVKKRNYMHPIGRKVYLGFVNVSK